MRPAGKAAASHRGACTGQVDVIEPQFAALLVALEGAGGFGAAGRAHRCFLSALVSQARTPKMPDPTP